MNSTKPSTPDQFFAGLPSGAKVALERLRAVIRTAVPEAEEVLGYGIPTYRLAGKPLVSLGAASKHLSLYVMDTAFADTHAERLAGFDASGGAIRFTPAAPLPADLVQWVVEERVRAVTAA
ncbi:DUF1801 domain-containing protein [Agromyces sp. CFH 90414]|uniref:DUF1801 domain-containing protein n=1 Tax=Agromyces agglutinans TaxID=2662258 RepID=A0A6I2EZ54_9MICO|nr:DUF1801 domain-containing protein [Agromyces agglutinans]MRG58405.1 DUF1801 domain-containing protein [Agromyces agglutinans]